MSHDTCDDDGDNDTPYPPVRAWKPADDLTPQPPSGWLRIAHLGYRPYCLDIGCWICALWQLEKEEKRLGLKRLHMIARNTDDTRVLLVAPQLKSWAIDLADEFNCILESDPDMLAGDEQFKAMQVLARRAWSRIPYPHRITAVQEIREFNGIDVDMRDILTSRPSFIDDEDISTTSLQELIEAWPDC